MSRNFAFAYARALLVFFAIGMALDFVSYAFGGEGIGDQRGYA